MEIGIEHHAVLYALLVRSACRVLGEDEGRRIMGQITYAYGVRRGQRMAANARMNQDLPDINSFFIYGEWTGKPNENVSSLSWPAGSSVSTVYTCAWYDAWKKHGLLKEGTLYCRYVDAGLAEGFAGTFQLDVEQAIGKGDPVCIFRWNQPGDPGYIAKRKEEYSGRYILPFSFHAKELLEVTKEYLPAQYPNEAEKIVQDALCSYTEILHTEAPQ